MTDSEFFKSVSAELKKAAGDLPLDAFFKAPKEGTVRFLPQGEPGHYIKAPSSAEDQKVAGGFKPGEVMVVSASTDFYAKADGHIKAHDFVSIRRSKALTEHADAVWVIPSEAHKEGCACTIHQPKKRVMLNAVRDSDRPVRVHKKRRNQSEAYHKRVQKKWVKRWGRVPEHVQLSVSENMFKGLSLKGLKGLKE